MCYDSPVLRKKENVYLPSEDLVTQFLELADAHNLNFYFGLYDSGNYAWEQNNYKKEADINMHVIEEAWTKYGHHPSFKGWYLSQEISRKNEGAIHYYQELGKQCKAVSGELPVLISPYIDGSKAIVSSDTALRKNAISITEHEDEWDEILDALKASVDIVAFQDGQVDFHELADYLILHKRLADKHGLQSWSNVESFDRDMPIKFLPIKWEKLKMKIEAAAKAKIEKLITFEFSHFMSPQSTYPQAGHLFNRYNEYLGEKN